MCNVLKLSILSLALIFSTTAAAKNESLYLKRVSCSDPQMAGAEAFSLLIPKDWHFTCHVDWNIQNVMPSYGLKVESPDGSHVFEIMPGQGFYWNHNPWVQQLKPVGSVYMGTYVYPPISAEQYIEQVFIPQYRGHVQNLQKKLLKPLPELKQRMYNSLARAVTIPAQIDSDAVEFTISYTDHSKSRDERITAALYYIQVAGGVVNWGVDLNGAITTKSGGLPKVEGVMSAIGNSFVENRVWRSKADQLKQMFTQKQISNIHHLGELSRQFSQMSNEIADDQWRGYQQRSTTQDAMAERYSHSLRGTEQYTNPIDNRSIDLPSGYNQTWTNGTDYILSNDPNFDPSIEYNQSWTPLKPTH